MEYEHLTERIIGAAIEVHRLLGPGLLESACQAAMERELGLRGLRFERHRKIRMSYKGIQIDCVYVMDLVVESKVVVELKSVDRIEPVFLAQLLTYLKLTGYPVGLLINFNVPVLKAGIRRLTKSV